MSTTLVYDTGALLAADQADVRLWALHRRAVERGARPVVPTTVLAQAVRSPGTQATLARLLQGCDTADLDRADATAAGKLLAAADRADVVDAHVVVVALARAAAVVTSDRDDLSHLAAAAGSRRLDLIPV
jgi:rRNA-processing protein FCF1